MEFLDELTWENTPLYDFVYKYKFIPVGYEDFFNDQGVNDCLKTISDLLSNSKFPVFPRLENVFKALYYTPSPKVVILGQDPYHTIGPDKKCTARGLSFSVIHQILNPSLLNIQKEVKACGFQVNPKSGDLSNWASQGVLLLNTALTVQPGIAGSHIRIWVPFTELLLEWLSKKYSLTWFLWGGDAMSFEGDIKNKENQKIFKSSHPCPLGATKECKGNPPFIGCGHFKLVPEIDWSI